MKSGRRRAGPRAPRWPSRLGALLRRDEMLLIASLVSATVLSVVLAVAVLNVPDARAPGSYHDPGARHGWSGCP